MIKIVFRQAPDIIRTLNHNEIFVFASNLQGRHGKGSAKQAMKWGAIYGQGEGITRKNIWYSYQIYPVLNTPTGIYF